ncbi:MAG TPA: glycoside hydrolase family 15 protein [Acidobacteriota bacterium]|nr:glycoside hydrolase family 15 protein [Acidobacteriota bacterium]
MAYQPIEDYGMVGDMRTVALVGMNGSIDWMCFPEFDSPAVFAALLDDEKGGCFHIGPRPGEAAHRQMYWPDTNVLITRFLSDDGVGEIIDFMPVGDTADASGPRMLIRRVHCLRGCIEFRMMCRPAFNFARDRHQVSLENHGAAFHSEGLSLGLCSSVEMSIEEGGVRAGFTLNEGQQADFVLRRIVPSQEAGAPPSRQELDRYQQETIEYWRHWISQCEYKGRWREIVQRSALCLKLLTYRPSGALVAAPTCSLPENIGGERNWDYRYTWIRDASFTLYGLLRIGFTEEAADFMRWMAKRSREVEDSAAELQIVYGIDGRHQLQEEILDHLKGYQNSRPVRVGNGANRQLQLDIYGELMDAVYLFNKYGSPISYDLWTHLRELIDWVAENWRQKDESIWEVRSGRQHFVFSKVMCWVALDRGLRLADKRSFPAPRLRWLQVRDEIYEDIMEKGWSEERQAFVQHYGSDSLDASNLIMPLVFFLSPTDPRMLKTLDAIMRPPQEGGLVANGLVYRYNTQRTDDGLEGEEGTFNICTFWLVEALTRAGRVNPDRLEEARLIFEQMLGFANHLGLFAEETGPRGEALGNFPQAFTHLSLISAAYNLDRALGPGD